MPMTVRAAGYVVLCLFAACEGRILQPDPVEPAAQRLHRLNRLEYNNTVRDLLATELRPADAFPPDGEADGFDNMAEALQLTPGLLDGYYRAARLVIDDALDDHPLFAVRRKHDELGVAGGYPVGELWALSGKTLEISLDVPGGAATVALEAGASRIGPAPAPELRLEIDGAAVKTFTVLGTATVTMAHIASFDFSPGAHVVRFVPTNFINDAAKNTSNNVLVRVLSVESNARTPGPGRDRIFICDPTAVANADDCYRDVATAFAQRAWRRPLSAAEAASVADRWTNLRDGGESDEQALRLVMRAVMTSPKFLYRARTSDDADTRGWLDDYVIASRLSYALWSTMPDDRLLFAAAAGQLSSEAGLADAVGWMLADKRARGLLDGFAEQWLSTRQLATASPNPEVFPTFDEELRQAMVAESKEFFADYLANGQPVVTMLDPDFAYVNPRLITHYGVDPIDADGMVRVSATATGRAGILSLSAWLTATSHAEHSSPIRRGQWVSDRILCQPVPPPPPGLVIEPIDPNGADTLREQLERHRGDPACAGCHALLDVIGMGFEEYDGIGRRRTETGVDMLGELPDGRSFAGARAFASLLDERTFAQCMTAKLYAYALGRRVENGDLDYIDSITERAVTEGLTLPQLIAAIVTTPGFRSPGPFHGGGL